ncbi:MAG TPA: DUF4440 domain-containing protein [Gammaproteobacteria bacterium]|nr:DUF4440 domain-containing protein [Gammaproteobacteria bacterium]
MRTLYLIPLVLLCFTAPALADAGHDIDQANQDWSTGMVQGDAARVADAYAVDAVFCDAKGICTEGHDAIERLMADRLKAGRARSAEAHSTRRVADGRFVFEWGEARLVAADGKDHDARYFTVWAVSDGRWKILRNLVLP